MVIPVIIAFILAGLIGRTATKLHTSRTIPTVVSVSIFMIFAYATKGAIEVTENEIIKGVLMGILMYLGAALVIFIGAFIWLKMKSPRAVKGDAAGPDGE